jgi:ATPase subunit of ABC transporter with duplicated ATPase domains
MRRLLAATMAAVLALSPTVSAGDGEAAIRAQVFAGCHGVYRTLARLAEDDAAAKVRFTEADEKATALARDAAKASGDAVETIDGELDRAADEYEKASAELSGGTHDRAKLDAEAEECDELLAME